LKRCLRLVYLVLFAGLPLWAQESSHPADDSFAAGSTQTVGERVPNPSGFEVLSKGTPQELQNYPFRVLGGVRKRWYPQLAELKKSANWKRGTTVIEFQINRDGSLGKMRTVESSGEASLDAAASQAISSAAPFPILPDTYPGKTLRLRYHFGYDQPLSPEAPLCNGPKLGAHAADRALYKVGNGVAPPHPINSTDPEYSETARQMKYQSMARIAGTVDRQGAFTDVCVVVPAGAGLDEKAMAAVRTWRFEPATREGEPVAVRIQVEVNFRLC